MRKSGLTSSSHTNNNHQLIAIGGLHLVVSTFVTVQLTVEGGVQSVPPTRPRLARGVSFLDDDVTTTHPSEKRKRHRHPVVIVGVDGFLRHLQLFRAKDNNTIVELISLNTELSQLGTHSLDTVAFLDSLVSNTGNSGGRRPGSHRRHHQRRQERIGHGFHVHFRQRLKLFGASDGGQSRCLGHGTTHRAKHIDGETGITLQQLQTNVGHSTGGAGHGSKRQRVSGQRRVQFHHIFGGVGVGSLRDVVSVFLRGQSFHLNAKLSHHGDGHVDVQLRNRLTTNKSQGDGFVGVRSCHQDQRHVLQRDGSGKLDTTTLEPAVSGNLKRQQPFAVHVLNADAVQTKGIDKRTNRTLLHSGVTSQNHGDIAQH